MIEKYIDQFKKINVAKRDGLKAPHKAVLLLAVIDLVERGVFTTPKIELIEELEFAYQNTWDRYVYNTQTFQPRLTTPFWHLSNEDFWRLRTYSGQPVSETDNASSAHFSRDCDLLSALVWPAASLISPLLHTISLSACKDSSQFSWVSMQWPRNS